MIVGRAVGWLIMLAGLSVLVRDVLASIEVKAWAPIALGQLWYEIDPSSLNLFQAMTERYASPLLWDPVIVSLLLCWAFAVLVAVGASLLLCFRKRRTTRRS